MIDGFDISLAKTFSKEELIAALAGAYAIHAREINLQFHHDVDLEAPENRLSCLVNDSEWVGFSLLLTLSSCETGSDDDCVTIAAKISHALGTICVIPNGLSHDDDTWRLVDAFEAPKRVLIREEYDAVSKKSFCYLEDYE